MVHRLGQRSPAAHGPWRGTVLTHSWNQTERASPIFGRALPYAGHSGPPQTGGPGQELAGRPHIHWDSQGGAPTIAASTAPARRQQSLKLRRQPGGALLLIALVSAHLPLTGPGAGQCLCKLVT
jgi:hypothetical protein